LALLRQFELTLKFTVETHVHADHVTGAHRLRDETGSKAAVPEKSQACHVDAPISEGRPLSFGSLSLQPIYTPGHTNDHHCYLLDHAGTVRLFTGDALMIDGCGRTDFQNGDAATLFRSVHEKMFTLPDDTLVYPGHDYERRHVSSIGQEKARNPRLGGGKTIEEFVALMGALNLPRPKKMDIAVASNRNCGEVQIA